MYKYLFFCILMGSGWAMGATPPKTLLPLTDLGGWLYPAYCTNDRDVIVATADLSEIRLLVHGEDSTRSVARGERIGRRFAFEPGGQRLVFRARANALPGRPERLVSTSLVVYDPVQRTSNNVGDLLGPYFVAGRVLYRQSPLDPFLDYEGETHVAGPYLDPATGRLLVRNEVGDTVFTSAPSARIAGAEISPNGKWVAVVQVEPKRQLLIISVETGGTVSAGDGFAPSWAGNSQSLICVRRTEKGIAELCLVAVPSGQMRVLLSDDRHDPETPALNADGTRALFISRGGLFEIEIGP